MEPFEINEWQQTIEELKSDLSEASPYLNYFKRFFGKKNPKIKARAKTKASISPSISTPTSGFKYNQQLNSVIQNAQSKLKSFVESLPIIVKNNMKDVDFTKNPPPPKVYGNPGKPPERKYIGAKPKVGFEYSRDPNAIGTYVHPSTNKSKLPINTIFENTSREWENSKNTLIKIMNDAYIDVSQILIDIAKNSRYPLSNYHLTSLVDNIKNFKVLDERSKSNITEKCNTFINTYKTLMSWLELFQRTEQAFKEKEKEPTP